jgi:uncharacterized protein YuzE
MGNEDRVVYSEPSSEGRGVSAEAPLTGTNCVAMKFSYDPQADCAYIQLVPVARGEVHESVPVADEFPELKGDVNLDLSRDGRLLGIEIVGARKFLPEELLRR